MLGTHEKRLLDRLIGSELFLTSGHGQPTHCGRQTTTRLIGGWISEHDQPTEIKKSRPGAPTAERCEPATRCGLTSRETGDERVLENLCGRMTIGADFLTTRWNAEVQRRQFLLERSQAFSEFLSLNYLSRSGSVPQECQPRLEECRRLRQAAIQTYLFLPTKIQDQLIKSFGAAAVAAASAENAKNLSPEATAFDDALRSTREWLTGDQDKGFNFILPCASWTLEEKQCLKK
jgi:hypothetical protein